MELKPAETRRFRFAASVQAWTWLAVFASVAVCLAIIGLQTHQEETMRRYRRLLTDLREARVDLARGYLHLSLSNDRLSPFSREEGLALLDQSIEALREVQSQITPVVTLQAKGGGLVEDFQTKARAFREQLTAYCGAEPAALRDREVSLRLAFHELERLVQRMDDAGQGALQTLSARLHAQIAGTLAVSVALLSLVCLGVYRVGRKQQAAVRDLRDNQARLQASEARYRTLFDQASEGIMLMATDGSGLQVNAAFARMHGYGKPEEMASIRFHQLLAPQIAEQAPKLLRRAAAGEQLSFEADHYRKDGSTFTLSVSVTRLELDGLPYLLSFYRDITDRKAAREAIRKQLELQDQFAKIVTTVPGVIYSFERGPDGKLRMPFCTPAMEEYWGVQPSVLRDDFSPAFARIRADDAERVLRSIDESARALTPWRESFRVCHPEKGEIWLEGHSVPRREPDGSILWHGFLQDITERKRADDALRVSEEMLKDMERTAKVGGWSLDPITGEGRWTEEVARIHDLDPATKPNREMGLAFYCSGSRLRITEAVRAALERGTPYDLELEIVTATGQHKWIRTIGETIVNDGKVVRLHGSVQDITLSKQAEEALRESEERLKLFIEYAPASLAMFDRDMRYLAVSRRWQKDYRLEGRSILGLSHYEVFPEISDGWKAIHQCGLAGEVVRAEEDRFVRTDGSVQWLRWEVRPWRTSDGRVGGIVIFSEDVTDRVEAAVALKESEERYRALVETTFDWVWEVDTEGRYTYVSPKVREVLGYAPEEVLGRTPFDLMPEAEAQRVRDLFLAMAAKREPFSYLENVNRHKDGRDVVLETSGVPVLDADGQLKGYRGMDRDITARKQAEVALCRSEAHLRTLVNTLPDLVWLKDSHGVYLACNARFEQLFGAAEASIAGKTDYHFMSREQADTFRANDAAAVAAGGPRINEEEVTFASDGHKELLETIKTPMFDADGGLVGVLGVGRDITARKQADEALRQSEERRALAMDAAQAGTWEWDLTSGRNTWSDELWRLYGLAPRSSEPSYEVWRSSVHPDDLARVEQRLRDVVAQGAELNVEWRVKTAGNDVRWLMSRGRSVRDVSGRGTHYLGVVMDITARKRAELALETEAARLVAVLDAQRELASADLEYADLIQLILTRVSGLVGAEGASLEVAEGDEMVYEAATGLAAPFVGLRMKAAGSLSGRCMTSGELMRSDNVESDARVDREACRRIGLRSMILVPMRYEEHAFGVLKLMSPCVAAFSAADERSLRLMGEFLGATISRKRTEEQLREREERLQTLGDNIPGGAIYQLLSPRDGQECFTYVSAGIERLFGLPAASVLADPVPFWGMIVEEDRAALDEAQSRSLRDLTLFDFEFRQRTATGEVKWVHAISKPRRLADGSTIWDGVLMDITARKSAESERANLEAQLRQAQKLESVGRLAGGVAHDFNNLLMSIMGHAELCREGLGKGHPSCSDLDEIMGAAQRSAGITRQLLTFARRQTVSPVVLDVNDHVANTLNLLRRLIGENIELVWRPEAQQAHVKLDPTQLDQILANLAVNARDAIADVGQITVETRDVVFDASTCPKQEGVSPGAYVMLAVRDTGCGMDSQTLEHIFEPFFTTKPLGQGTGLGLATVYGIVKQNQGLIDVQSEPGKGTVFGVYFRRHEEPAAAPGRAAAPEAQGGAETVLLVEDEDGVRAVTARSLKRLGYTVLSAGGPAAALRLIAEHAGTVHLLITDVVMPGMGGRELAAKLAGAYPAIKCLLISGYPDGSVNHQGALEEGVNFLAKPFSSDDLAHKVREVLGSR